MKIFLSMMLTSVYYMVRAIAIGTWFTLMCLTLTIWPVAGNASGQHPETIVAGQMILFLAWTLIPICGYFIAYFGAYALERLVAKPELPQQPQPEAF